MSITVAHKVVLNYNNSGNGDGYSFQNARMCMLISQELEIMFRCTSPIGLMKYDLNFLSAYVSCVTLCAAAVLQQKHQ